MSLESIKVVEKRECTGHLRQKHIGWFVVQKNTETFWWQFSTTLHTGTRIYQTSRTSLGFSATKKETSSLFPIFSTVFYLKKTSLEKSRSNLYHGYFIRTFFSGTSSTRRSVKFPPRVRPPRRDPPPAALIRFRCAKLHRVCDAAGNSKDCQHEVIFLWLKETIFDVCLCWHFVNCFEDVKDVMLYMLLSFIIYLILRMVCVFSSIVCMAPLFWHNMCFGKRGAERKARHLCYLNPNEQVNFTDSLLFFLFSPGSPPHQKKRCSYVLCWVLCWSWCIKTGKKWSV